MKLKIKDTLQPEYHVHSKKCFLLQYNYFGGVKSKEVYERVCASFW